ncbi:hypothetical protein IG631_17587 [Alternaria alternata]|nr:hypothetical protein IG631_17587 [Alternaria alternata]
MSFVSTTRHHQLLATARPGYSMTVNPFIPVQLMRNTGKRGAGGMGTLYQSGPAYAHRGGYRNASRCAERRRGGRRETHSISVGARLAVVPFVYACSGSARCNAPGRLSKQKRDHIANPPDR